MMNSQVGPMLLAASAAADIIMDVAFAFLFTAAHICLLLMFIALCPVFPCL